MTLKEYQDLGGIIALRRLCKHAGLDHSTMTSRVRRGGPQLSATEVRKIIRALNQFGLVYDLAFAQNTVKDAEK